ncbi:MAG: hypothetical protein LBT00_10150 [Spirochaetaceae bacterium]|nr:hypothetical protein [Spirochaetaceae bacterium]
MVKRVSVKSNHIPYLACHCEATCRGGPWAGCTANAPRPPILGESTNTRIRWGKSRQLAAPSLQPLRVLRYPLCGGQNHAVHGFVGVP